MKRYKLAVEKRKIVGKKVKKLRKDNTLPANIYGKDIKSLSVQVPYKDFEKVYKEAGETGIIDVQVDGQVRPSLIHNVQQDYYNHKLLHADFFQVNLKEKVKTMVPVIAVGVAKAISDKLGLLLQPLSEVEIEALPTDLPDKIEVNVEPLDAVNAQITVSEIKPPTGVTILTDPSQVVVKIGELISKAAAAQAAAEAAAAGAAKAASDAAKAESDVAKATSEAGKTETGAPSEALTPQPTQEAGKPSPAQAQVKQEAHSSASGGSGQAKPQK